MNPNPYAPPSSAIDLPAAPAVFELRSLPNQWTMWSVIRDSWSIFRRHWLLLLLPSFALVVLGIVGAEFNSPKHPALNDTFEKRFGFFLVRIIISAVIEAGWVGQLLAGAQGQRPGWASYRTGLRYAAVIVGITLFQRCIPDAVNNTSIITGQTLGSAFFVPGGIWGTITDTWMGLARCAAIAEGLSWTASLKRAWTISTGCRKRLLGLGVASFLIVTGGMVLLFIGVIFTNIIGEALPVVAYVVLRQREAQTANEANATFAPTSSDLTAV